MGRKALGQLVHEDGPPYLCVLVGDPRGRWHLQAMSNTVVGKRIRSATTGHVDKGIGDEQPIIVGLVVAQGWRFIHSRPQQWQTELLMDAPRIFFRRRYGIQFEQIF